MGKLGELVGLIERLEVNLIFIQESWLDASVVNPVIHNFYVLSRRDRNEKSNRGGIIIYVRGDLNNVIAFKKCAGSERLWCLVQRDSSCVALCNWYLSPGDSLEEIDSLRADLDEIRLLAVFFCL